MKELLRTKLGALIRAAVPLAVKRRIWAMPCAVCGVPYGIKVDHVVPVARGGGPEESNLQPLCHDCNHTKHTDKSNEDVAWVIERRGLVHFEAAVHREGVRCVNSFDRPSMRSWLLSNPEQQAEAAALYAAFLDTRTTPR